MRQLGNGLSAAKHHEDELIVEEAQLSMLRRLGASEYNILGALNNLANTHATLGRLEEASRIQRDVYYGHVKLNGEGHLESLAAASNYATSLVDLERFEEAKSLLRSTIPVARRVVGESSEITLRLRWNYAMALYKEGGATLGELREAVTTLEDTERIARRVFGSEHPLTEDIERNLRNARAALRFRETPPPPSSPSESA